MYTFITDAGVMCLTILINDWPRVATCFHMLFGIMGDVVVVEEESGPTSSGNASQGEMQGVRTATFYQWKYSHYFTVVEEGVKNMRVRCMLRMFT